MSSRRVAASSRGASSNGRYGNRNSGGSRSQARTQNKHVTISDKAREKEAALLETLQDAEMRQLESFVKRRSLELDQDIEKLQQQLHNKTAVKSIENEALARKVLGPELGVQGVGLANDVLDTDFTITAAAANDIDFEAAKAKARPPPAGISDHLVTFLARIKLKMEDVNMAPDELKELLLPSDLVVPGEHFIPIGEVTGVLQTDLLLPVTKNDQLLLLRNYGNADAEIDVRALLSDAGVWYEGPVKTLRSLPSSPGRYYDSNNNSKGGGYGDPLHQQQQHQLQGNRNNNSSSSSATSGTSRAVQSQQQQQRMLSLSEQHLHDLDDLHSRLLQEKEFDFGESLRHKHSTTDDNEYGEDYNDHGDGEDLNESLQWQQQQQQQRDDDDNINAADGEVDVSDAAVATAAASQQQQQQQQQQLSQAARDRLSALSHENERLKSELGQFDSGFFEELEDLKFRYSRLQEIVGEDPYLTSTAAAATGSSIGISNGTTSNGNDGAARGSKLPLQRLSWAVRNSMTAMDRAGLTSPLVSRPRYANAFTYSPGGSSDYYPTDNAATGIASSTAAAASLPQHRGGALHDRSRQHIDEDRLVGSSAYPPPQFHSATAAAAAGDKSYDGKIGTWHNLFGGEHAIGAGTHAVVPHLRGSSNNNSGNNPDGVRGYQQQQQRVAAAVGETFSNLCERRLAFELSQHSAPETATRSLIHRVMDAANRDGSNGFISVPQLEKIFALVKIHMSTAEVELLATGFASDAMGGIDAHEFCEAVKSLLYNLLGEHAAQAAEEQAWVNGNSASQQAKQQLQLLLKEMCEGILAHDRRAVLGSSPNVFKTLLKPFVERDNASSGTLDFTVFWDVLKDIGVLLTYQDVAAVARHYALPAGVVRAESAYPSSNLNHIQSFRDAQLKGALSGAAKVNPAFGDWLSDAGVGLIDAFDRSGNITGSGTGGDDSSRMIEYTPFVTDLAEEMIRLMELSGGVVMGNKFPWILREFEFVDTLIVQLEEMKPSQRRKVLMSLQYALAAADPRQECELDGFCVLNALLNAGFRLQRVNRVRLLRAVEELGGKMDYRDLCQVLLNSCADWTSEEKHVVKKILKAMGVTVLERRSWLAKLRQLLMEAAARVARKSGRWFASEGTTAAIAAASSGAGGDDVNDISAIPPSAFLHCLRECGVVLNVEDEATLLDCLDTERLSQQQQQQQQQQQFSSAARVSMLGREHWSIPMIHYESFLQYCARHCGSWTDAAPELNDELKRAMRTISNATLAVHEFASLLHAFDERDAGVVSKRAFQICCHRSRLLTNLPDAAITQLSEILTADGGGSVEYVKFVVHLRALSASFGSGSSNGAAAAGGVSIVSQLVHNASDKRGTLLPLRNWLLRHTDMETFLLTARDLNSLLREFSVMYRPEDLEQLQMDVGRHVDNSSNLLLSSAAAGGGGGESQLPASMKKHVVDSRDLLLRLLQERPHWTTVHPHLCKRMLQAMKLTGIELFNNPAATGSSKLAAASTLLHMTTADDDDDGADHDYDTTAGSSGKQRLQLGRNKNSNSSRQHKILQGPRGIETAVARRVLSRLRAFSGRSETIGAVDRETRLRDANQLMVERDIFKHIAGVTGLPLSDEDVLLLADATDFMPEASRVRCDVILEALLGDQQQQQHHAVNSSSNSGGDGGYNGKRPLSEAGVFALEHLRQLLWTHADRLHRSAQQWEADVRTVFRGFDYRNSGFISSEDFVIALQLLNSSVSPELLLDISYFPEGPGLVDYRDVLDFVLRTPNHSKDQRQTQQQQSQQQQQQSEQQQQQRKTKAAAPAESPVQSMLRVIRKALHQFIVSDHSLEAAWVCMLKVFQRFDPQETNLVSPRDFCLAVSVLLEGDEIVLTKSEWAEIIDFFAQQADTAAVNGAALKKSQTDFLGGAMVDYMSFCEAVLDPNEIRMRAFEDRGRQRRNGKENHQQDNAAAGADSGDGGDGRLTMRHCAACSPPRRGKNNSSSSGGGAKKEAFSGGVSGSRIAGSSVRPTSRNNTTVSRYTQRKLLVDNPKSDPAINRLLENRPSSPGYRGSDNSSRGGSSFRAATDLYGRTRTTGQASRMAARSRNAATAPPAAAAVDARHDGGKKWWGSLAAKRSLSPPQKSATSYRL